MLTRAGSPGPAHQGLLTTGLLITAAADRVLDAADHLPAAGVTTRTEPEPGQSGQFGQSGAPHGGQAATGSLTWPPFGGNVHIFMPGWLPPIGRGPAVVAAKNFLLAFLYAEYRETRTTAGRGTFPGMCSAHSRRISVSQRDTESFTGAISFSHMRAYPDPTTTGAIDVSECFDNSASHNTSLATGKIIPDRIPADQHYYRNTDVMARKNGQWNVVSVYRLSTIAGAGVQAVIRRSAFAVRAPTGE